MDIAEEPLTLPPGDDDDDEATLDQENNETSDLGVPLELLLSATTSALELETSASNDISLNGSDLLEEESENDRPLVLFVLSDDGT